MDTSLLIHIGNTFSVATMFCRDVLALRVLYGIAASCLLSYFLTRPEPMWAPVCWNLVFIGIHTFWIIKLSHERLRRGIVQSALAAVRRSVGGFLRDFREWQQMGPCVALLSG